ncbi:uncharacterized protein LOC116287037 [Actinia tenebrosa]|uniref:Uncharacterized protein LOC116287037 n=1 Tax=Actinia tenebrosa TaxID=6105 RepID=A0A6P8HAJ3_ACTTE|nr:uncharacterized protein LOC116287037 [Actinia tenebrosa]
MQPAVQYPKPPRSPMASLRSHRTLSNTTTSSLDDDNVSLSSSFSGSLRRSTGLPKISTSDFSAVRAAVGISRMKHGRKVRKATTHLEHYSNTQSDGSNPRGSRRTSTIYSLSELAVAGAKVKRRKRSTLETWGRRSTVGVTKYFDKHLPSVELFRRCVRLVQMFASLCQYKYEKENEDNEATAHTVFTEYINEDDSKIDGGLAFDASYFKANRKMRVSQEVKNILLTPPEQRTEQQLAKILFSLRSIRSFAEYPQRIQNKLIAVGWFESHSAKRAILRQGHIPQAFYFVLSGSAVVTVMAKNEAFARTVHFLRRGDSFGELAMLHDTRRQSTVISREPIELLVISREDFVDIFMLAGGIKNLNDPDHKKFIRGIEFLRGWPIELLGENPKKCLFHFFRSGSVLVKDSNHTDWIYIIKWGSCRILKKLKQVKSQLTEHKERVVGFENVKSFVPKAESRSRLERVRTKLSVVTKLLPKLTLRSLSMIADENEVDKTSSIRHDEGAYIEQVAVAQGILARFRQKRPSAILDDMSFPGEMSENSPYSSTRTSPELKARRASSPAKQAVTNRKKLIVIDGSVSRNSSFSAKKSAGVHVEESHNNRKLSSPKFQRSSYDKSSESSLSHASQEESPGPATSFMNQRARSRLSTKSNEVNKKENDEEENFPRQKISVIDEGALKQNEVQFTEADRHPVFVQVALLSKGDVFGVSSMLFDDQPSLSLVSNGAECIMISKKFYLSHCTDSMKRRLLTTETPYPDEDALQRSLQDKINWDAYKKKTLQGVVKNINLRRQFENRQCHLKNQNKKDTDLCEELKSYLNNVQSQYLERK